MTLFPGLFSLFRRHKVLQPVAFEQVVALEGKLAHIRFANGGEVIAGLRLANEDDGNPGVLFTDIQWSSSARIMEQQPFDSVYADGALIVGIEEVTENGTTDA